MEISKTFPILLSMRKFLKTVALSLVVASTALAGTPGWETEWDSAKAKAKAENKFILINLTGTDWCSWCVKLEKEVFSTKEFKEFAAANVILMEADFPKKKELSADLKAQNEVLKKKYLKDGYPTVLLLDAEGNRISEDLGELAGGTQGYIKKITELIAAKRKP